MSFKTRLIRSLQGFKLRDGSVPATTPATLSSDNPIEEETLPQYCPQRYYPVRIGETFDNRFLIVAKLGYGASSTVWLARDTQKWSWQANPFVALKILTNDLGEKSAASTELEISSCIVKTDHKSEGLRYLRTVLKSFEVTGPKSTHVGLVYAPMRESVARFQRRLANGQIPSYFLKPLMAMVLTGLDYLHSQCRIIHTDLKPDNILLGIENQAVIDDLVNDEAEEPTPRKVEGARAIYLSRNFGDLRDPPGPPKIADFGLAVWGNVSEPHNHPIQADLFQAPEVILRASWTYSVDIWNLGVMLWDLVENRTLFDAFDPVERTYSPEAHLLEMTSLLGPPPTELLKRGQRASWYFTAEGKPLQRDRSAKKGSTIESCLTSFTGADKRLFLEFVRRMLRWMPEDRATAAELLQDPWLKS
ncbi:hypothetical protein MMC13_007030 [Lambiella insularis]|nr:hypothetical protein [Lambiella insularis]